MKTCSINNFWRCALCLFAAAMISLGCPAADDTIHDKVDEMPTYKGGNDALMKFMDYCAEKAIGQILVKDGNRQTER